MSWGPYRAEGELPLTVHAGDRPSVDELCAFLGRERVHVEARLVEHGALRFKGFAVEKPEDFERIARAIDPDLKNEYLGTSPRDGLTDYVFSASELPDFYPIPQHCEMSFCANPPRRVFFSCLRAPGEGSGETPLCDFRKVWRDLDPAVRERFVEGGLRIIRNYGGPQSDGADPLQLKGWDAMFLTTDHTVVEEKCREQGFEVEWLENERLRLISTQPVYRDHPTTGERVWHNHVTTFHLGTALAELRRIAEFRPSERHRGLVRLAQTLEERLRAQPPEDVSMHCTYLDGREIPEADLEALRDTVWRHLVVEPWENGDVIAIDNDSTSHGRLPYEGPRRIAVCWA